MNEEQTYLVNLLEEAIQRVYREERFLLKFAQEERTGLEQAFVFRTGIHLNNLLCGTPYKTLDLDSEYNKILNSTKKSRRFPNGIRPDLIIHKRNSNKENKLVAEFKGWWNNNVDEDFRKLEDLTSPDDNYHYSIGVFVKIGKDRPDCYRYFVNGKRYE